jgi:NADH-quinone oxidoreductase subunit G
MNENMMYVDGMPVAIEGEKNLLELIRKAGVDLPTFCYHSELSVYGACRMCMVEDERGGLSAACSTPPRAGMEVFTSTPRLRKYRKTILELLLSNHCRDCTTCPKNGRCKLQELAARFGVRGVRFENAKTSSESDRSSDSIVIDRGKCILCGDCVRMCNEVQRVGAIDFAHRGSKMTISTAFGQPIATSGCVSCGQCAAICPTGAILIKSDKAPVWAALSDKRQKVVAQVAPAVRVAVAREFGLPEGENSMGRIVAALRRLGFDEVYDTATGADLTVVEESYELTARLSEGGGTLFTSCCPSWVEYARTRHPELSDNISSCKSPMGMLSAVIKAHGASSGRKIVTVAVMPCTAKKHEAALGEDTDYVITTLELVAMIRESGLIFDALEPEAVDSAFSTATGAGLLFGASGGVTEAVLRRLTTDKSARALSGLSLAGVRTDEGIRELTIEALGRELPVAIVSGLANAEKVIERVQNGERFDFVEVMACPGGCVGGAGQPLGGRSDKTRRAQGLYAADRLSSVKRSEENPLILSLYSGILRGRAHELLHVGKGGATVG